MATDLVGNPLGTGLSGPRVMMRAVGLTRGDPEPSVVYYIEPHQELRHGVQVPGRSQLDSTTHDEKRGEILKYRKKKQRRS